MRAKINFNQRVSTYKLFWGRKIEVIYKAELDWNDNRVSVIMQG